MAQIVSKVGNIRLLLGNNLKYFKANLFDYHYIELLTYKLFT